MDADGKPSVVVIFCGIEGCADKIGVSIDVGDDVDGMTFGPDSCCNSSIEFSKERCVDILSVESRLNRRHRRSA